ACAPFPPPAVHYLPTRKAVMAVFLLPDGYIRRTPGSANDNFHTPHLRRRHSQSDCKGRISHNHTRRTGTDLPDRPSCSPHFPGKNRDNGHSLQDNPAPLFLQPQCRPLRLLPCSEPLRTWSYPAESGQFLSG